MNFQKLLEAIKSDMAAMDESRGVSDVTFDKFAKTTGAEIARVCDHQISRVMSMPGINSYKRYVDGIRDIDINDPVSIILSLENYYEGWINSLDKRESNKIVADTKRFLAPFKLKGKVGRPAGMSNKTNADKATLGLDYTPNEPQATEPEIPVAPKKRGRPSILDELKKKYVPTGNPRGRKPKEKQPEPTMREVLDQMNQMKSQIAYLQSMLDNRINAFSEDKPDTDKIYESLERLKSQYKRFL